MLMNAAPPTSSHAGPARRLLPHWAGAVVLLVLLAVYLVGAFTYPARGEEPRRADLDYLMVKTIHVERSSTVKVTIKSLNWLDDV